MTKPEDKNVPQNEGAIIKPPEHLWFRRGVLSSMGWGGLGLCACAGTASLVRMGYPRVLHEPPTEFKAGSVDEYRVGEVSTRWIKDYRVWIVREKEGFYALYASCTHLGCTPGWLANEGKFKCFCHGSGFHKTGINYEGPAPRPLERVKIALADDGQLILDTSVRYRRERGEWGKQGSFFSTQSR